MQNKTEKNIYIVIGNCCGYEVTQVEFTYDH
jgi:hypothetical protein